MRFFLWATVPLTGPRVTACAMGRTLVPRPAGDRNARSSSAAPGRTTHWTGMQGTLVAAVVDLTQRQHGAATTHQLRRLGVSAKAQRTAERDGWLVRVEPGVVVLGASTDTWLRRLRVGLLALDARGWVSHEAAAALYGWPGGPAEPVEFTVPRDAPGAAVRGDGPHDRRRPSGRRPHGQGSALLVADPHPHRPRPIRRPRRPPAGRHRGRGPRRPRRPPGAGRRLAAQAAGATKSRSCSTAPTSSGRRSA